MFRKRGSLHAGWCAGLTLRQWVDARPLPAAVRDRFDEEFAALIEQHDLLTEETHILLGALTAALRRARRRVSTKGIQWAGYQ